MATAAQKVIAYSNISTDFTLDVTAKKLKVNLDNSTLIRNSSGQLSVNPASYIENSLIGANNGVAPIDGTGHVPNQYINFSGATFKGTWDASTNTPTVIDGVGTNGDFYLVSNAGSQDLGSGSTSFSNGDIVIYNGSIGVWQRSGASMAVTTVNGLTGAITLTTSNVAEGSNLYFTTTRARGAISTSGNYLSYNNGVVTSSIPTLATVASSGSYADLSNKPTIPAAQVNSDWNSTSGLSQILNKPTLATVATTGSYTDLINKPALTLPPALDTTSVSVTLAPTSTFYTMVALAAGLTQTLPAVSAYSKYVVNAKNGSSGTMTVTGVIDGKTQSITVPPLSSLQLHADSSTWWIL